MGEFIFNFYEGLHSVAGARHCVTPRVTPPRRHARGADTTPRGRHCARRLQRRRGHPSRERTEGTLRPLQSRGPAGRRARRRLVRAGNVRVGVRAEARARHGARAAPRGANAGRTFTNPRTRRRPEPRIPVIQPR